MRLSLPGANARQERFPELPHSKPYRSSAYLDIGAFRANGSAEDKHMIPFLPSGFRAFRFAMLLPLLLLVSACSDNKTIVESPSPSVPPELSPKPSAAADAAMTQEISTDRFFVNSKPQTPTPVAGPEPMGDLSFTIDVLDARNKVARVRGWGFRITPPHQTGDRVTVLLVGPSATYSALADVDLRPDVSAVLKRPGMDDTGFVSLIDAAGIEPGEYTLFLRIGGADGEAIESTNQKLTL